MACCRLEKSVLPLPLLLHLLAPTLLLQVLVLPLLVPVAAQSYGAQSDGAQSNGAQSNGAQSDCAQSDGAQSDGAHMDSYFMERFPTPSAVDKMCGVCMGADEVQCGSTSTLLYDGQSPQAVFIGTDAAKEKLERPFGDAYECFTPDVFEVTDFPSPTTAGSFAPSTLPATIAGQTGFYASVWQAAEGDVVRVNATNKVTSPVRVLGVPPSELGNCTIPACPYGTIKIREFRPAPAEDFTLDLASKALVEAFLASDVSAEGRWAAAILLFHNGSDSSLDLTYLLYFTDAAAEDQGSTKVYAFEASFEDSEGASAASPAAFPGGGRRLMQIPTGRRTRFHPRVVPKNRPSAVPKSVPSSLPRRVPSSLPRSVPSSLPRSVPSSLPRSVPGIPPMGGDP